VTAGPSDAGAALGETSAITKGFEPVKKVVIDGADKLREGGKVELNYA